MQPKMALMHLQPSGLTLGMQYYNIIYAKKRTYSQLTFCQSMQATKLTINDIEFLNDSNKWPAN